ncbi:cytochrome d ubiquinol oxidase subunit II [Streptomyces hoynatensis]|uniref:Cytochrome d ubiquinol oxidase subunit II n=1 Tax=Streptomyces hoynatensis TaxID=1141874 RepID=A0A3A9YRE1_9ACTN|nr:cytochrome d ubiquinol oxidase subunit II [Streptomyces hoynatensis]
MQLTDVWFLVIAVLWTGYFFLEGFDFGVGVLSGTLARDRAERRVLINTIGPVWDGNEVWLIAAGGATFAAFPEWYASLFSGFYLPLVAVLVCLIVRGLAFEYRAKRPGERWQRNWERAVFWCSLAVAFLWGVTFANLVRGVPLDSAHEFTGGLGDLLSPYALLGGVVAVVTFTFHGATFTALKTVGDIRTRARRAAGWLGLAAGGLGGGFLLWTQADGGNARSLAALALAGVALLAALAATARGREGYAFAFSGLLVVAGAATLFLALYPDVMPSSPAPEWSLTVDNAASAPYTLRIMTWCAALATPLVLVYQGWTYWVFRQRIGTRHLAPPAHAAHPAHGAEEADGAGTGTGHGETAHGRRAPAAVEGGEPREEGPAGSATARGPRVPS